MPTDPKIPKNINMTCSSAISEIGMRFLTDPTFSVSLNSHLIKFSDIPNENIRMIDKNIDELGNIRIIVIDTQDADKTTSQHGIAWHVNKRLVGTCSWKYANDNFLDGRFRCAKRLLFIVQTDFLEDAVLPDWSNFKQDDEDYIKTQKVVKEVINIVILELSESEREEVFNELKQRNRNNIFKMGMRSREKWENFIKDVQILCPTINDKDLNKLAEILANIEISQNKYIIFDRLLALRPDQLDELSVILDEWTLDMAKIVLDELKMRLSLLAKLKEKIFDVESKEVQDLQPLFHQGLWIFGPEYETIEYTSNEGMTRVIETLFHKNIKGSKNRPDFAILPDSTVGLYSYPNYDSDGGEIGTAKLTIVELKKAGIIIGEEQKAQCWKYIKELYSNGLLDNSSRVSCFVLGTTVDSQEVHPRKEKDDHVIITPIDYNTVISRAKTRLHKLFDRVKEAPFLNKLQIEKFINNDEDRIYSLIDTDML